jgi:hypothetical protein
MTLLRKTFLAVALLGAGSLLAGCPGMPGMPGGAASQQQNMPAGVLPPPGLESGGVRTLMGTTITAPEDSYLLVSFTLRGPQAGESVELQSCRRITAADGSILIEGLNYDNRLEGAPKDVNRLLPEAQVERLEWKYELKPTPPAETSTPGAPSGKQSPEKGQPAKPGS